MYSLMAILCPSVFGIKLLDYFNKRISLKNTIYYYLLLVMFSNVLTSVFVYIFFKTSSNYIEYLNTLPIFFAKYVLVSLLINFILVIIITVSMKNMSFKIEVKNEKKGKNNK